ncbi:MAG: hypothetical protein II933_03145 [Candidatus Methanomethylophilaceae archaeon]|nr:hypothetical protein [Thermoplasmata archaeon]MBQ3685377.1 hypothetical protein [Candidatus Methanomethylophilaceae archaeon]
MGKSIKEAITGDSLLLALMYILIGIVMLAFGNGSIDFIFWITGVIMIIFGILQIVLESTDIKGGLITIVIGIIVIILSWTPIDTILVGIILILCALPMLGFAITSIHEKLGMKAIDMGNSTINKIIAIVLVITGVCLIIGLFIDDAGSISDILIRVGGLILLAVGVLDFFNAMK